ncbi:MAG: beta-ketoacyl-[acyl-carrier-protein] synthase [Rhizobacter sp.]|nr:beta-ketoacyl-[acyl-carrier-protein] synthase [Rhizobacter sp.]
MLGVDAYSTLHAAGPDNAASWRAMQGGSSGLKPNDLPWCDLPCWIGEVPELREPTPAGMLDDQDWLALLAGWDCRQHRLAWLALARNGFDQAVKASIRAHGAHRVGVIVGSTTSGIRSTEQAYRKHVARGRWPDRFDWRRTHSLESLGRFAARVLGCTGPTITLSTACSSSAKVFLLAQRWIDVGLIDVAVVGGVDSLCESSLRGFASLDLLSPQACQPFDEARAGISIGEAAGFVLLGREKRATALMGGGEASDAWHMSTPHPDGRGATQAMRAALDDAGLGAAQIGYVNAHGTATRANDRSEAAAMRCVFGAQGVAVSSTKGVTGHTLGAAGVTEAIVAIQTLEHQALPPSTGTSSVDDSLELDLLTCTRSASTEFVMSNSFGFGGSNCSLIFGRVS